LTQDVELETPSVRSHLGGGCLVSQTNCVDHTWSTVGDSCHDINVPVSSTAIVPLFEEGGGGEVP